jgi:hypothetical protein
MSGMLKDSIMFIENLEGRTMFSSGGMDPSVPVKYNPYTPGDTDMSAQNLHPVTVTTGPYTFPPKYVAPPIK